MAKKKKKPAEVAEPAPVQVQPGNAGASGARLMDRLELACFQVLALFSFSGGWWAKVVVRDGDGFRAGWAFGVNADQVADAVLPTQLQSQEDAELEADQDGEAAIAFLRKHAFA